MEDALRYLKMMLGSTDDKQDELLQLFLDVTEQSILNFINRKKIPKELRFAWINMTRGMWIENTETNQAIEGEGQVSSISESGRSVSFKTVSASSITQQADEKVSKMKELGRFRLPYRS